LLAEAGYPKGFDAGEYYCDSSYSNLAEAVVDNLGAVGIRTKLRPFERVAFLEGYAKKSFKNIIQAGTGAFGNAATRLEATAVKGGVYAYGSDPEIDRMFEEQAAEMDHERRSVILQRMQQLLAERTIFAPIWQLAFINGVGPRVGQSGFDLISGFAYTGPYEDITLKGS